MKNQSLGKFFKIGLMLVAVFLMTSGLSCRLFNPPPAPPKTVELTYWGVWDDADNFSQVIQDFSQIYPYIHITYKKFRFEEYEQKLLEAWAEDRGPDLYSLPSTWLKKYQARITPMPPKVQLLGQEVKRTLGKTETFYVKKELPTLSLAQIKNDYADIVYNDVVLDSKIYGLPLSIDTLVLYYNRDLLDAGNVAVPPTNWTQMAETVKKLVKINEKNEIQQAGIALGTAKNVPRSFDILSLLMIQNGTTMANDSGQATFNVGGKNKELSPGLQALLFYTDFANPLKEVYTWNTEQPNAFETFISGKTAMMYGYSYFLPLIKTQAPKLDIGIAPMTQIEGSAKIINYTDYWVETVSHKTKSVDASWAFLNFISSQTEAEKYLQSTKKPAALRKIIEKQKSDSEIATFANQTLTSTHWYKGYDILKAEEIFEELIENAPLAEKPQEILDQAARKINNTLGQ